MLCSPVVFANADGRLEEQRKEDLKTAPGKDVEIKNSKADTETAPTTTKFIIYPSIAYHDQSVRIYYEVTGKPEPTIELTCDGTFISESDLIFLLNDTSNDSGYEYDLGHYATNDVGAAYKQITFLRLPKN